METLLNKESRAAIELMVADGIITKDTAERYFPELKESEDERIRINIINWLKNMESQTIPINEYNSAIAWLEKQGKQKSQEEVVYNLHNYLYGEQKPAWSEEDEEIWNKAKQIFPESLNMQSGYVTGCIDTFKHFSLKKEWSEDDMKVIKEIIFLLKHHNSNETLTTVHSIEDMINWLKSLKERYYWKPNDEQMAALSAINVAGCISYAGQGQELINLYNDLKKLKGE